MKNTTIKNENKKEKKLYVRIKNINETNDSREKKEHAFNGLIKVEICLVLCWLFMKEWSACKSMSELCVRLPFSFYSLPFGPFLCTIIYEIFGVSFCFESKTKRELYFHFQQYFLFSFVAYTYIYIYMGIEHI